jgi:hypothetical protein
MTFLRHILLVLLLLGVHAAHAQEQTSGTLTFKAPMLITDVGQGNSSKLIEALLKRSGDFEFKSDSTAGADALAGVKTLIIGVGASSKGLGAAGLNAEQERERAAALLQAAKQQNIPVIGVHIGGIPRRGELSDGFNRQVLENSSVFVVWQGGNEDKFFTTAAEESKVPLLETDDKRAVGEMLTKLLTDGYDPTAATGSASAKP